MSKKLKFRTASETAELLGVTTKAIKLYEDRGLICPPRTEAGWRVYGLQEIEILTKILALKSAGFSLSDIKEMFEGGLAIADALEKQSHMLSLKALEIEKAIAIISGAEAVLEKEGKLSMDMLVSVANESVNLDSWMKEDNLFAEQFFNKAQMDFYHSLKTSPKGQAEIIERWSGLIDDIETARRSVLSTQQEHALIERWKNAMAVFSGKNAQFDVAVEEWLEAGYSDTKMKERMPFSQELWRFMNALMDKNRM